MSTASSDEETTFRDTLYTIGKDGKRQWVYSTLSKGRFFKIRLGIAVVLILFFLVMPWVKIAGKQGIWLDIAHRKFTFFGTTFWATDTLFLVLVLGSLAIALFFFTSLFGRIWCGWACPETLFLEFIFRPIDRLIEGNASQRARLDKQPWNRSKVFKKGLKYCIYAVLSWIIASTLLAYIVGSDVLITMMSDWPQNNPGPFALTLFVMGLVLFQFGWFREQFCTVLCPYARFQSVLMDANSLVVGYDPIRGEPRGKASKKDADVEEEKGDCIDCKLCLRVCPTGIDIRNGLQLECVSCTQCIDACDSIMEKIGKPKGLIRYDTENSLLGNKSRIIRPRVLVYGGILLFYAITFIYLLQHRALSDFQVIRTSSDIPFSVMESGIVSNHFEVKLANKGDSPSLYSVSLDKSVDAEIIVPISPYPLAPQTTGTLPIFINFKKSLLQGGKKKVEVKVASDDGFQDTQIVTLLGPE